MYIYNGMLKLTLHVTKTNITKHEQQNFRIKFIRI